MTHQQELEIEFKTAVLPEGLRDTIYQLAYEEGHAFGLPEVRLEYEDRADLALAAYDAGRHGERNRIAAEIRAIGPDFDADDYVEMLEGRDPQDRYKGTTVPLGYQTFDHRPKGQT